MYLVGLYERYVSLAWWRNGQGRRGSLGTLVMRSRILLYLNSLVDIGGTGVMHSRVFVTMVYVEDIGWGTLGLGWRCIMVYSEDLAGDPGSGLFS